MHRNEEPISRAETQPEEEGLDRAPDGKDDADDADDIEDREHGVTHRPPPAPNREEEDEELAEADILQKLDDDELKQMEGPDA